MPTILLFITLNNFLKSSDVVSIKLMELVFFCVPSRSLLCASRKFFILMLPFSQKSWRYLKIRQRAN